MLEAACAAPWARTRGPRSKFSPKFQIWRLFRPSGALRRTLTVSYVVRSGYNMKRTLWGCSDNILGHPGAIHGAYSHLFTAHTLFRPLSRKFRSTGEGVSSTIQHACTPPELDLRPSTTQHDPARPQTTSDRSSSAQMLSDDRRCLQMPLIDFAKCPRPVRVRARAPPTTTRVSLDTCTFAVSPHQHIISVSSARGSLCCSMGAHSRSAFEIFAQLSNLAPISAVGGVTSHSNGIICGQKRV